MNDINGSKNTDTFQSLLGALQEQGAALVKEKDNLESDNNYFKSKLVKKTDEADSYSRLYNSEKLKNKDLIKSLNKNNKEKLDLEKTNFDLQKQVKVFKGEKNGLEVRTAQIMKDKEVLIAENARIAMQLPALKDEVEMLKRQIADQDQKLAIVRGLFIWDNNNSPVISPVNFIQQEVALSEESKKRQREENKIDLQDTPELEKRPHVEPQRDLPDDDIESYRRKLSLNKAIDPDQEFEVARTFLKENCFQKALIHFENCLKNGFDVKNPLIWYLQAQAFFGLNDFSFALKNVNKSIDFKRNGQNHQLKAMIYLAKNNRELALQFAGEAKKYGLSEEDYKKLLNRINM